MKHFSSLCVRESKENRTTKPHILPIYATSSFDFEDMDQQMRIFAGEEEGHVYSRYGNPTIDTVAAKIAALEAHGIDDVTPSALLFSSGMSAILTLMLGTLQAGDKILTQANLYGGTTEQFVKVLAPCGIKPIFIDLGDISTVRATLQSDPSIRMIYGESPANPTLACIDLQAVSQLARSYGVLTAIDNTFPTPYLQQPFGYGIDFIVHSTTKYLNGHGNSMAGALVGRDPQLMKSAVWPVMKLGGTNCNAWDAWLLNNGLKTLPLRMQKHCENAKEVASYLSEHPSVQTVNYPGLAGHPDHALAKTQMKDFGGMISFVLKGGMSQALQFMRRLKFCTMAPTLGDIDTLVLHPASSSHINVDRALREQNGIVDGLVRISAGIEAVEDIIEDLEQALA